MSQFSFDILHNILSRLPAKDLFRLKVVCKLWKGIINDPFFVKSHTKNQQSRATDILIRADYGGILFSLSLDGLNYADNIELIFSLKQLIYRKQFMHRITDPLPCNGLILISIEENIRRGYTIWNPLVKDFHDVPPPPDPNTYLESRRILIGYEASDDYKVVSFDKLNWFTANEYYRTLIYSLKLRCWKAIEGFPGGVCYGYRGVYLNGALHWRSRDGIIALHLGREDHHLVAVPPRLQDSTSTDDWDHLDALDGCLILRNADPHDRGMDVWMMNSKDYETDKAWTKLFSVVKRNWDASRSPRLSVVAYLKSKGQVFLHYGESGLIWLDLENKCSKEITVSGLHRNFSINQFTLGSLVRLDSSQNTSGGVKRKREEEGAYYARFGKKVSVRYESSKFII